MDHSLSLRKSPYTQIKDRICLILGESIHGLFLNGIMIENTANTYIQDLEAYSPSFSLPKMKLRKYCCYFIYNIVLNFKILVASPLHMQRFPDIVMNNFDLRIFYISDANERQNQVPIGYTTIHAIFLLTVRRIQIFQPKTFLIPRGIIPQNFSLLGYPVSEELGNKQTKSLTDRLVLLQSDKNIAILMFFARSRV